MRRLVVASIIFLIPTAAPADVTYGPKQLYTMVTNGVPLLERGEQGDVLHLKRKRLTEKQKRHIEQLSQLGYMDGTAAASERCSLSIKLNEADVGKLLIYLGDIEEKACDVRLVVWGSEGKIVRKKSFSQGDVGADRSKESHRLTFDLSEKGGKTNVRKVDLTFKGCDAAIEKIVFK